MSSKICSSVTDAIGMTPMVQLNRVIGPNMKAKRVLAKLVSNTHANAHARTRVARIRIAHIDPQPRPHGTLSGRNAQQEMQNPGGSVKDRIAKAMIEDAERTGALKPGMTIVEATSGNTGIGIAMVAAAKGYKCIIIMPQLPPMMERYIICRKFGADVHLTAGAAGAPMVENMLTYMNSLLDSSPGDYWCPRQFENDANPICHESTTGPEIWDQTDGEVDYFVAGAGTGGTMAGVGPYLKAKRPSLVNVLVEPEESRVLAGVIRTPAGVRRERGARERGARERCARDRAMRAPRRGV